MNRVILIGNLGKDPEHKTLDSGVDLAKFPLATSRKYKNRAGELIEDTTWHNIVCWAGLAKSCASLLKGRQVMVEGEIKTRSYDDKDGVKRYTTEIIARNVDFLGGGLGSRDKGGEGADESFEGLSFSGEPGETD